MSRSQFCTLLLGGQRSGKSFYADEKIKSYPANKRVLIVDPDGQEKVWQKYPLITLSQVATFKGIKRLVYDSENPEFIRILKDNFKNGLLVYDDAKTYITIKHYKVFETQLVRRRASNIDIYFMYHGFSKVLPLTWGYITHVVLFRLDENPELGREFLKSETETWKNRRDLINASVSPQNPFPRKVLQIVKHIS